MNHDGGIGNVWVAFLRPNVPVLGHWSSLNLLRLCRGWLPAPWDLIRLLVSCFPFHAQPTLQLDKPRPEFRVMKLPASEPRTTGINHLDYCSRYLLINHCIIALHHDEFCDIRMSIMYPSTVAGGRIELAQH